MNNREAYAGLARDLDVKYRAYCIAWNRANSSLRGLLEAVFALSKAIDEARANTRMPFAGWCLKFCVVFDPKATKAVTSVAHRTHNPDNIETWQLRLLNVVSAIHHSTRPQARKRRHKPTSWLSYISKTREEINKLIEQRGGAEHLSQLERAAIDRQLASLDNIRTRIKQ